MTIKTISIPQPHTKPFVGGINHPDLFLWDAWSFHSGDSLHLYCLAINRQKNDGTAMRPEERTGYQFHIRLFTSADNGLSWRDAGVFQTANLAEDGHDERNIWSGSILPVYYGRILVGYTGLSEISPERPFVQNLAIAESDFGAEIKVGTRKALLCPLRDEAQIRAAGYYLSENLEIGSNQGEQGGPILAWRDPYLFFAEESDQSPMMMVWAAKKSSSSPAMGMAQIGSNNGEYFVEDLLPPIAMPDGAEFTQLECPKIYFDTVRNRYLLLIASTTRKSESQPDHEVKKTIRMYFSEQLQGPWISAGKRTSVVAGLENLFAMTVLKADFEAQKLLCIAPYTEAAKDKALSFESAFWLDISGIGEIDQLAVEAASFINVKS